MAPRFFITLYLLMLIFGCKNKSGNPSNNKYSKSISNKNGYPDNTYCAEVKYHNPNTGTSSSYTLTVDVDNNQLVEIHWPNGGHIDRENFTPPELDESGHTSFTNEKGYDYEVQIIGQSSGCFNNVPLVKQCKGITKGGKRCKHMTDNSNGLCWQHQNQ